MTTPISTATSTTPTSTEGKKSKRQAAKKPLSLRLKVVDRGVQSSTGCGFRDLYLQTNENDRGKPESGWQRLLCENDVLLPRAERLIEWFESHGIEVVHEKPHAPLSPPDEG